MTSSINPNLINGAYPVAGQDNSTKGMRDNFTNIKTNFEYAASEITALQTNTVITGSGVTNDFGGAVLVDAQIRDFSATRNAIGTTSGTVTVNYASGHYQTLTTSGSVTLAFSNFPASGQQGWIIVRVTVASTAHTLTLPAAVGTGASAASVLGIQGIASNVITFTETGTYEFQFHTDDGGATIYLSELTRPRNRYTRPLFLTGSEDLAPSAAASLGLTTSYFTTAAAETATLAAGTAGQIKVFSAVAIALGNMVITVTNAGWKASGTGTITFATLGCGCTLQYTNSKWFCIGNNGCTFA
jgi:hypothetical protein